MAKAHKRLYRITRHVESVQGWQVWEVEAHSEKEALELHKTAECVQEEIEIIRLGNPEIKEITDAQETDSR